MMRSIWLILLLSIAGLASAAELTARLDRAQITDAETVTLTLTLSGDASGVPDLTPLAADFDLINQSHTSRMSFINGVASRSQLWRLALAPKRTGQLTVPSLTVGTAASEPVTLEVLDAALAPATLGERRVFLQVEAAPESPYVQGRVDYRVRLYSRVQLLQPRLLDPEAKDAIVQQIGDDEQSSELIDGVRYSLIERRYAIFPQRSGTLEIAPPRLIADVPVERDTQPQQGFGQDPFGPLADVFGAGPGLGRLFTATRQVRLRGKAVRLDVRPQPPAATSPWLPAESVQLSDEWSPDKGQAKVGEAITRTLTITAAGVMSAQLPDLELSAPAGIKLYPDPPQAEDRLRGEVPVAVKQVKVALVPTEPGPVTLPEVRLAWWDTTTDEPREALVPKRTLTVAAADSTPQMAPRAAAESGQEHGATSLGQTTPNRSGEPHPSRWIGWAFAAGWLATIALWWRDRRQWHGAPAAIPQTAPSKRRPGQTIADARLAVERACRHRGPRQARDALLEWGALAWPDHPPRGLAGLAARLDSNEAAQALTALERGLYAASGPADWDGPATWAALAPALRVDARDEEEGSATALPDLYPKS